VRDEERVLLTEKRKIGSNDERRSKALHQQTQER